jgi:uncharacterized protein (TIGR00730 family)
VKRVCVYAGSNLGARPEYGAAAEALAAAIVGRGCGVVFGGADVGLMKVVADTVLQRSGTVIGVMPGALEEREIGHPGLTELHLVDSMHERKALMADLSDAFVALPGGFGTVEEIVEMATWAQLGLHAKPVGFLDVAGYYKPLVTFFDRAVAEGFIRPQHRDLLHVSCDPEQLLDAFEHWQPPHVHKWIDRDET